MTCLVFHELARSLTSTLDLELHPAHHPRIHGALHRSRALGPAHGRPETKQELYYAGADGGEDPACADMRVKVGEGLAGWVASTAKPSSSPKPPPIPASREQAQGQPFRVRSAIGLPIRGRKGTHGVLEIFNPRSTAVRLHHRLPAHPRRLRRHRHRKCSGRRPRPAAHHHRRLSPASTTPAISTPCSNASSKRCHQRAPNPSASSSSISTASSWSTMRTAISSAANCSAMSAAASSELCRQHRSLLPLRRRRVRHPHAPPPAKKLCAWPAPSTGNLDPQRLHSRQRPGSDHRRQRRHRRYPGDGRPSTPSSAPPTNACTK
jgi:hypothetical protein